MQKKVCVAWVNKKGLGNEWEKGWRKRARREEDSRKSPYKRELAPGAFHFKNQRSRGSYFHLVIFHMVSLPYMGLS